MFGLAVAFRVVMKMEFEREGLPLHLRSLPSERAAEGVSIIIGKEYP